MKTKFWSRKNMVDLGFEVLGFDDGCNKTYKKYVKYFDEKYSFLYFQAISNKLYLVKLSESNYQRFKKGDFGLSFEGKTTGLCGEVLLPVSPILLNKEINLSEINNIVQMGKAEAKAITFL